MSDCVIKHRVLLFLYPTIGVVLFCLIHLEITFAVFLLLL